jgi:hypothetical protein
VVGDEVGVERRLLGAGERALAPRDGVVAQGELEELGELRLSVVARRTAAAELCVLSRPYRATRRQMWNAYMPSLLMFPSRSTRPVASSRSSQNSRTHIIASAALTPSQDAGGSCSTDAWTRMCVQSTFGLVKTVYIIVNTVGLYTFVTGIVFQFESDAYAAKPYAQLRGPARTIRAPSILRTLLPK